MNAPNAEPLVHFYDTLLHQIPCGVRGVEHRSTKHARSVTCQACVSLLVERRAAEARRAGAPLESIAR